VEAQDGVPTPWHLVHLGSLARGGAGVVIVEATGVVPEGRISPWDTGLWNDAQQAAWAPIVDFVHGQGALAGIQLAHAGRKASTYREWSGRGSVPVDEGGWESVAPSAVAFEGYAAPRALDAEELPGIVEAFRASARRAVDAGFDVIELHAAHGYLLHQFLSPLSNHREDAYGGALENRGRLDARGDDHGLGVGARRGRRPLRRLDRRTREGDRHPGGTALPGAVRPRGGPGDRRSRRGGRADHHG
jgi:2,4-dienoyl-CoA reductase-like NADH-dependent reductase (Old Yellow Enzyme family)